MNYSFFNHNLMKNDKQLFVGLINKLIKIVFFDTNNHCHRKLCQNDEQQSTKQLNE